MTNIQNSIMTSADKILSFLFNLKLPFTLYDDIEILDAHQNVEVKEACISFYKKFYDDQLKRRMLLGINPGRFGGGVTGIPFTDPIRLPYDCELRNNFRRKQELSSVCMYEMMRALAALKNFISNFMYRRCAR